MVCFTSLIFDNTCIVSLIMMSDRFDCELAGSFGVCKRYAISFSLDQFLVKEPLYIKRHVAFTNGANDYNHFLIVDRFSAEVKRHNLWYN